MSQESSSSSAGHPLSGSELAVYECLVDCQDFLPSIEIMRQCELQAATVMPSLDKLFRSRLIMARFALQGQAIIVTCDEVRRPEIGFSRTLYNLLVGIGVNRKNWIHTTKTYAAFDQGGGFPDCIPEGLSPLEPYQLPELPPEEASTPFNSRNDTLPGTLSAPSH